MTECFLCDLLDQERDIQVSNIMITVAAAILGVTIPLILDSISRITERFRSPFLPGILKRKVLFWWVVGHCVALIVSSLCMQLIAKDDPLQVYCPLFLFNLALFLSTLVFLIAQLRRVLKYINQPLGLASEEATKTINYIFGKRPPKAS